MTEIKLTLPEGYPAETAWMAIADSVRADGYGWMADSIEEQVKPTITEPTAIGSVVSSPIAPGMTPDLWVYDGFQWWNRNLGRHWSALHSPEVLRVGVGPEPLLKPFFEGAAAMRQRLPNIEEDVRAAPVEAARDEAVEASLPREGVIEGHWFEPTPEQVEAASAPSSVTLAGLLDAIDDGNLTGTRLRWHGHEIYLHTTDQVTGFISQYMEDHS